MTVQNIIAILTFLISAIALAFSLKKQVKEEENVDADTIKKLYETIDLQEKRYKELRKEMEAKNRKLEQDFMDYKRIMTAQITQIANENTRLRAWANKLVKQLKDAEIIPCEYE